MGRVQAENKTHSGTRCLLFIVQAALGAAGDAPEKAAQCVCASNPG